jgi:MIP family channel proteins
LKAHLAEFLGTFALVFFGCGAIATGQAGPAVAAAFGLAIAAGVFAFGPISGAHFNPAVSVGLAIGRHFPWTRVGTYVVAQVGGAVAAAAILRATLGAVPLGTTHPSVGLVPAVMWEAVMTGALMIVITAVATGARASGEAAALAIGGTVALAALVGGPVTGASLNPARSVGPAVVAGDYADLGLYLAAPVIGAVCGALAYRFLRA